MVTIRQVAQACSVSPMTVSYVLNNRAGAVSEETREKVLRVVREMNYRPTPAKKQKNSVLTLGLVTGVAGHSLMQPGYYNAIAVGIIGATDQLQHNITLFSNSLLHTDPHQSLRTYCDGRCDGLLVIAPRPGSELVETLRDRGIPCVLIGDTGDVDDISYVDIDNIHEGFKATDYLIQRGHRRIAFIPGPDFVRSCGQRKQGYLRAMEAYGLTPDVSVGWGEVVRDGDVREFVCRLTARPKTERPTALFCWNDGAAFTTLQALREFGVHVPQEMSVMGIDDSYSADASQPPLTTLRQPHQEIGQCGVEIVIRLVQDSATAPQHQFFPTQLIVRESVSAPA